MTWEDHAQNCENSTPCPRGDECAPDESCFSSSPCATLNDEASAEGESNVGNFCGTDWSTMIATVSENSCGNLGTRLALYFSRCYLMVCFNNSALSRQSVIMAMNAIPPLENSVTEILCVILH